MTLSFENVEKRRGAETLIHPASFDFAADGFNVLLGATNAGKTTLIKMVAGLERPSGGAIRLNGADLAAIPTRKRRVSLVHQFFVNYPHMSVFENIASPLRVAGLGAADVKRRVGEAAELMRLTPYLDRKPSALSGGQQQRTALARAIVKDSDIVLLDEPLANLDYKLREELRDQLPKLFADRGAIVVYATSEPSEALMLGGRTATLNAGRVTQVGDTANVYRAPADLQTAQAFSDPPINTAPIEKAGGEIRLGDVARWPATGAIADAPDGAYQLGLRPHFVAPAKQRDDAVLLPGEVRITELSGSESVAHFDCVGGAWVSLSDGTHAYSVGEPHDFFIDTRGCLYFDASGARVGS